MEEMNKQMEEIMSSMTNSFGMRITRDEETKSVKVGGN